MTIKENGINFLAEIGQRLDDWTFVPNSPVIPEGEGYFIANSYAGKCIKLGPSTDTIGWVLFSRQGEFSMKFSRTNCWAARAIIENFVSASRRSFCG